MNRNLSTPPRSPEALRAAQDRLEEAFARHQDELLGTLYYFVGNIDEAQDALQEAFVKCWRSVDQVPRVENLRAWIFRIALNTGRDQQKAAWNRRRQPMPEDSRMTPSTAPLPPEMAEQDEQLARVRRAVLDLRSEEKEVFLLRQNGELSYEQIATTLGIPPGTAKTRMRRALMKLREALAE